jgi:hypothetical protein
MAFHPFRWFRKHQKVIWGFLVILCMVTFVFMSGTGSRGDIFDRLVSMVRGRRTTTPVTQLYGATVDLKQLRELGQQRLLAYQAEKDAKQLAFNQVAQELEELNKSRLNKPIDVKDLDQQGPKRVKLEAEARSLQPFDPQFEPAIRGALTQTETLLDFLVWRHQADKLGIQLTAEDVGAELRRRTSGRVGLDEVVKLLRGRSQLTEDTIRTALAEEFRVALAQEALLNSEPLSLFPTRTSPLLSEAPAPVTPYEFWKHFEKERTAVDLALVPLPVEPPANPAPLTSQDLREVEAMYQVYKDKEAQPEKAEPGFKVPRRVKVGWVTARPDAPYYQKLAGQALQSLRVATAVGSALGTSVQTGLPAVADGTFLGQYYHMNQHPWGEHRFDVAGLAQADYPLSVYTIRAHPEESAALVGALAAGGAPVASSLGGLMAYQAGASTRNAGDKELQALVAQDLKEKRIPYGLGLLGVPETAGLLPAGLTVAGLAAHGNDTVQSLPSTTAVVRELVEQRVQARLALNLADANLHAFQTDLDRERARGANAEERAKSAAEAIAKGLETYHLEAMPKPMTEARDRYDLPRAPGLAPLKEALLSRWGAMPAEQVDETFANAFFQGQGDYDPKVWPPGASLVEALEPSRFGMQFPPQRREPDPDVFLVWRTEDKPAYVPSYDEVKERVIAAWRRQKARSATADEAAKLREAFAKTGGDFAKVVQLAAEKNKPRPIELKGIARMVPEPLPVAGQHRYQAYQFPEDLKQQAGADWVNELVDKLKTKGDTLVLHDRPEKTYYVAVLLDRIEPSLRTFHDAYRDMALSSTSDQLLEQYLRERQTDYRKEFLTQLRVEAGAGPDGKYKLDPDYLKMQEGRGGEE